MATGFGIDPTLNGAGDIISGTTSQDIRKIYGGLYTPGIISGAEVTTSASIMQYTIKAGVVAIPIATGETVIAPVPATSIMTAPAPVTGTRTDIIYAKQNMPELDGSSSTIVGVGTSLPARAVALGRRIVTAGIQNTNAATLTGNLDYSIPYGASLGILAEYRDPYIGVWNPKITKYTTSIYLPTDRIVSFQMLATISAEGATRFDNAKYCEAAYEIWVDNVVWFYWTTGGLHQAWQEWHWGETRKMAAGQHTIRLDRMRTQGPGSPVFHGNGYGSVSKFSLTDIGAAV